MTRWYLWGAIWCILAVGLAAAGEPLRSEADLQAELKKLAEPPGPAKLKDATPEDLRALSRKRAETALAVIQEYEAGYPKSPALIEARIAVLDLFTGVEDETLRADAAKVAVALKRSAVNGSDPAARADLFLLGHDVRKAVKACKSLDDAKAAWGKCNGEICKQAEAFLRDYPKYRPGADALNGLAGLAELCGDGKTAKLLREAIARNLPDHPVARALVREQAVGQEIDFAFTPAGSDKKTSLKELRGQVVVINFWASWCVPCRAEQAGLKERYEKYHKDGLEIVGVCLDEKEDIAQHFIKERGLVWTQILGETAQKLAEEWGIETIPMQFLVDRKGRLRSTEAIGKLDQLIPELLGEKQ